MVVVEEKDTCIKKFRDFPYNLPGCSDLLFTERRRWQARELVLLHLLLVRANLGRNWAWVRKVLVMDWLLPVHGRWRKRPA